MSRLYHRYSSWISCSFDGVNLCNSDHVLRIWDNILYCGLILSVKLVLQKNRDVTFWYDKAFVKIELIRESWFLNIYFTQFRCITWTLVWSCLDIFKRKCYRVEKGDSQNMPEFQIKLSSNSVWARRLVFTQVFKGSMEFSWGEWQLKHTFMIIRNFLISASSRLMEAASSCISWEPVKLWSSANWVSLSSRAFICALFSLLVVVGYLIQNCLILYLTHSQRDIGLSISSYFFLT